MEKVLRQRVYYVSHYAMTKVTNIVVARNAKEAVEKDEDGEHAGDGWASDASPMRGRPTARWARGESPEDYTDGG